MNERKNKNDKIRKIKDDKNVTNRKEITLDRWIEGRNKMRKPERIKIQKCNQER
jgi:hypothetical protein